MTHERNIHRSVRSLHSVHAANEPLALRQLPFHSSRGNVDDIEMVPPIALAHPKKFPRVIEPVMPNLVGVIDEGRKRLFRDYARRACFKIERNHAQNLMPTLVVLERDLATIRKKMHIVDGPRICEQRSVNGNFTHAKFRCRSRIAFNTKDVRKGTVYRITRLGVLKRLEPGLQLICRRTFDDVDRVRTRARSLERNECIMRRRNRELSKVPILRRAVRGHKNFCATREHSQAAIATNNFPLSTRRCT